jgi:hypothetical protein
MTYKLNLPPNPVVVYEYKDHISHSLQHTDHLEKARAAINMHLVGTNNINIADATGRLVSNPAVENHPNYKFLKDVHWSINASNDVPVIVKVYSDGHREFLPCEEFDDE